MFFCNGKSQTIPNRRPIAWFEKRWLVFHKLISKFDDPSDFRWTLLPSTVPYRTSWRTDSPKICIKFNQPLFRRLNFRSWKTIIIIRVLIETQIHQIPPRDLQTPMACGDDEEGQPHSSLLSIGRATSYNLLPPPPPSHDKWSCEWPANKSSDQQPSTHKLCPPPLCRGWCCVTETGNMLICIYIWYMLRHRKPGTDRGDVC